jgi:hypothetical protein
MKKKYVILVVGLGSLGLNYMKAISKLTLRADVYYYDKKDSVKNYHFKNTNNLNYFMIKNIKNFTKKIDLTIISTTANGRYNLINSLIKNRSKYWIIEKMIEQNIAATNKLNHTMKKFKCWVDIPRRGMKEYKLIKKQFFNHKNIDLKIKIFGSRIVTSSVHLIDLLCWLTNSSIKEINVSKLNKFWTESKRKGFYDIGGELIVFLKNNSKIIIKSSKNPNSGDIMVGNKNFYYNIDENKGNIVCSNGQKFRISPPHVSIIMKKIITEILLYGKSYLPRIEEVVNDHNILIKSLKLYWEKTHKKKIRNLPVT